MVVNFAVTMVITLAGSALFHHYSSGYGIEVHGIFGYASSRQGFTPQV
jgi:hypothetical protein